MTLNNNIVLTYLLLVLFMLIIDYGTCSGIFRRCNDASSEKFNVSVNNRDYHHDHQYYNHYYGGYHNPMYYPGYYPRRHYKPYYPWYYFNSWW